MLVLPRPWETSPGAEDGSVQNIPGPSEADFTETFGSLLPPASWLETPNGRIAYYHFAPSPPTAQNQKETHILLIHGVRTPALGLFLLAKALRSRYPGAAIVLPDLYGHGISPTPLVPHVPAIFEDIITALLDQLEWRSAHILGYSFGGSLLAGYMAAHPDKVDSATFVAPAGLLRWSSLSPSQQALIGPAHSSPDTSEPTERDAGDGVEARDQAVKDCVFDWLEGVSLRVPPDWRERVSRGEVVAEAIREWSISNHEGHVASVVAIVRDGGVFESHEAFRGVLKAGKPYLVILGEKDKICTKEFCEEMGLGNVNVVENVGHGVPREKPEEVASLIEAFWTAECGM